ncbi:rhs element Vgr family protein, partial [Escherichia coli 10.0869]
TGGAGTQGFRYHAE